MSIGKLAKKSTRKLTKKSIEKLTKKTGEEAEEKALKDTAAVKIKKNKEVTAVRVRKGKASKALEEKEVAAVKTRKERANKESAVVKQKDEDDVPKIEDEGKYEEEIEKVLEEKLDLKVEKAIEDEKIKKATEDTGSFPALPISQNLQSKFKNVKRLKTISKLKMNKNVTVKVEAKDDENANREDEEHYLKVCIVENDSLKKKIENKS